MRSFSLLLIFCLLGSFGWSQEVLDVYFDYDKSNLNEAAQSALREFMAGLPLDLPDYVFYMEGHTDSDGNDAYNEKLSRARVDAVSAFLTERGALPWRVTSEHFGEHKPVADNVDGSSKAKNRRVRIVATPEQPKEVTETRFEEQPFEAEKGVRYVCPKSGSVVTIPSDALVDAAGNPVVGEVELQYREWRDLADFIAFGGPMTYNQDGEQMVFESEGMFEVRVKQNGNDVFIAEGKEVLVDFVRTQRLDDAQLFTYDDANQQWLMSGTESDAASAVPATTPARNAVTRNWFINGYVMPHLYRQLPNEDTLAAFVASNRFMLDVLSNDARFKKCIGDAQHFKTEKAGKFSKLDKNFEKGLFFGSVQLKRRPTRKQIIELGLNSLKVIPVKETKKAYYFRLEDKTGRLSELEAFRDDVFVVRKSKKSDFDRKGAYRSFSPIRWQDFCKADYCDMKIEFIREGKANEFPILRIKNTRGGIVRLRTKLANSEGSLVTAEARKKTYQQYRDIRTERDTVLSKELLLAVEFGKLFRTKSELRSSTYKWLELVQNDRAGYLARYDSICAKYSNMSHSEFSKFYAQCRITNSYADTMKTLPPKDSLYIVAEAQNENLLAQTSLKQFGVANWDRIYKQQYEIIPIEYKTPEGEKVLALAASMIDFKRNAVITVYNPQQLSFVKGQVLGVLVRAKDKLYLAHPPAVTQAIMGGTLTVTDITEAAATKQGLQQVLGI